MKYDRYSKESGALDGLHIMTDEEIHRSITKLDDGCVIASTQHETERFNRESLQIWGKFAAVATILTMTIIGLVNYFS